MDYEFLSNTRLFRGTSPQEAQQMLSCLAAVTRAYRKGETIYRAGEQICAAGLVLRGSVTVESDDFWGNRSVLSRAAPGDIFGEAYACLPEQPLLVSVVAAANCEVLFLDMARVMRVCSNACAHHSQLVSNVLQLTARKAQSLAEHVNVLSQRTIRQKLLAYFGICRARSGSGTFVLTMTLTALADYLSVDRSAMMREMKRMKEEGVLSFRGRSVELYTSVQ